MTLPDEKHLEQLLGQIEQLKTALKTTLSYIEDELLEVPPSNIKNYLRLVQEEEIVDLSSFDHPYDFGRLVTATARLLSTLSAMDVFQSDDVGLIEWTVLLTLRDEPAMTNRQLSRHIGATWKRTQRVVNALCEAGMVVAAPSERPNSLNLSLSTKGEERLRDLNARLLPYLQKFVQRRPYSIRTAALSVNNYARIAANALQDDDLETS